MYGLLETIMVVVGVSVDHEVYVYMDLVEKVLRLVHEFGRILWHC